MTATLAILFVLGTGTGAGTPSDCGACHTTADWKQVAFNHETTRLPLRGRHAQVPCGACHFDLSRLRIDARCSACHEDPHAGRLGNVCERCHETTTFKDGAGAIAHAQTRFPLFGRHAMVPCDQCHQARTDRTFGGLPVKCEDCHQLDFQRTVGTKLDHVQAGLSGNCRDCHNPISWKQGKLAEHDRCFPVTRGPHGRISCMDCHTSLPTLQVQACVTFTAACTRCHRCSSVDNHHNRVAGYQCADRKCYECHPSGTAGG